MSKSHSAKEREEAIDYAVGLVRYELRKWLNEGQHMDDPTPAIIWARRVIEILEQMKHEGPLL